MGQLANVFHLQTANLGGPLGRPLQGTFTQGLKAHGVLGDVIVVQPVVADEFMHQRIGQCRVRARLDGQMNIALVGGFAAAWVDAHQLRTLALGLLRDAPKVDAAGDGIAAPNQDEFALRKVLHLHAQFAAQGVGQGFGPGARANRAIEFGGTQ